jgi:DNA-binding SARP family transcriptional activator
MALRLTLLGGFAAHSGDGALLRFPTRKAEALLAYLAVPPGRPHSRNELASLLWGDAPDSRARHSVRQTVFLLRRALAEAGRPQIAEAGQSISLDPLSVDVDVQAFETSAREGTVNSLLRARQLYGGDFLVGVTVPASSFEDWLLHERARLRELAVEANTHLLGEQRLIGAWDDAVQTALQLLALDPLQESICRVLMELYDGLGRRAEALRVYATCATALWRELGVEPEAETQRLYQRMRARPELICLPRHDSDTELDAYAVHAIRDDRTVGHLTHLADDATHRHAFGEALELTQIALTRTEPRCHGSRNHITLSLVCRQAQLLFLMARLPESLALLLRYRGVVDQTAESTVTGAYYFWLGHSYATLEQPKEAHVSALRAAEIAARSDDRLLTGQVSFLLAFMSFMCGDASAGVGFGKRAVAAFDRLPQQHFWQAVGWHILGLNQLSSGRYTAAAAVLERAEEIGRGFGHSLVATMATAFQADGCLARGDWRQGVGHAQRTFEGAGSLPETLVGSGFVGAACLEKGDLPAAIRKLELACQHPFPSLRGLFASYLMEAHLSSAHIDEAEAWAERAVADGSHHAYMAPRIHRAQGHLASARGAQRAAEQQLEDVVERFVALGNSFEAGRTHLRLAEITHAHGRKTAALSHLANAREHFLQSGCLREGVMQATRVAQRIGVKLNQ